MNISMKHLLFAVSTDGRRATGALDAPETVRARALGLIVRDLTR